MKILNETNISRVTGGYGNLGGDVVIHLLHPIPQTPKAPIIIIPPQPAPMLWI